MKSGCTIELARCFIGPGVRPPSGICHRSVPSLYAKVSLFGLIRGVLPIFSQVPALLNQELDSCFPWQTQGTGCPELPLVDGGGMAPRGSLRKNSPKEMSSLKVFRAFLLSVSFHGNVRVCGTLHYSGWCIAYSRRVGHGFMFIIMLMNNDTLLAQRVANCRWLFANKTYWGANSHG